MTTYCWTPGQELRIDAQAAGEVLRALADVHDGRLTPRIVLDEARPDTSPLHSGFEWDDLRAAERYREGQARLLLRSIRIAPSGTGIDDSMPLFSVKEEPIGGRSQKVYIAAVKVTEPLRQSPLARRMNLADAVRSDITRLRMAKAPMRPTARRPFSLEIVDEVLQQLVSLEVHYRAYTQVVAVIEEAKRKLRALPVPVGTSR